MNNKAKSSFENPPEEVVRAFASLSRDPNFLTITEWLSDCMIVKAIAASRMDNEKMRNWEDGKVQAIEKILDYFQNSRALAERYSSPHLMNEHRKVMSF